MNFNQERLPAYICKKRKLFLSEADEEEELEETIESSHGPTIPRRRIADIFVQAIAGVNFLQAHES